MVKAVAFVEKLDGTVTRGVKSTGKPVVGVFGGADAGLKELAPLKNLTTLHLRYTQVTDAGFKELLEALPR